MGKLPENAVFANFDPFLASFKVSFWPNKVEKEENTPINRT